ncbi:MAG: oligosaccharide flippase family protein [Nitrospirota bacterium]|jgi:O-antigen/teichoic acid export membrane protein
MRLFSSRRKSFKDLTSVFSATVATRVIDLARGFVVAKYLGPGNLGILRAVQLISMLDKFGNMGFKMVATREITFLRGKGEGKKELSVRNVAYSGEMVLTVVLFLASLASLFFFGSGEVLLAIVLASVGLLFSKISRIFEAEAIINKQFVLYSKVIFWAGLFNSAAIVATVPSLGMHAVLAMSTVTALLTSLMYLRRLDFPFRFSLERAELFRQLRIGIPLSVATLAYGSYRYAERVSVGLILGVTALGFYSLAAMAMDQLLNLFLLPVKVRKIDMYEKLGQRRFRDVHRQVVRETLLLVAAAVAVVPLSWVGIDIVIETLLPEYAEAALVCKVMVLAVPLRTLSSYMNVIIVSSSVDRQAVVAPLQFSATAVFVMGVLALKHFGMASLLNIVIADISGYALYHLAYIVLYRKCFVNDYLRGPSVVMAAAGPE